MKPAKRHQWLSYAVLLSYRTCVIHESSATYATTRCENLADILCRSLVLGRHFGTAPYGYNIKVLIVCWVRSRLISWRWLNRTHVQLWRLVGSMFGKTPELKRRLLFTIFSTFGEVATCGSRLHRYNIDCFFRANRALGCQRTMVVTGTDTFEII